MMTRSGTARRTTLVLARLGAVAAIVALALVAGQRDAERADAAFHFAHINEVMFGNASDPTIQYVEIVMEAAGHNLTTSSVLGYFDATGTYQIDILIIPGNVSSGANLKWIMGTASFAAASGMTPNFIFPPVVGMPATGMLCWGAPGLVPPVDTGWDRTNMLNWVDCVPYGSYAATPIKNGPATTSGLTNGAYASLQRIFTTDVAATDYAYGPPDPQTTTGLIGFNHDNHIDLPPTKAYDDLTWPHSDTTDDNSDDDDDNDDIPDGFEDGSVCGGIVTNPLKADTDGDLLLDKWECDSSLPNTDPTVVWTLVNPCTLVAGDVDGDKLNDSKELCSYGTLTSTVDTDTDTRNDGCEAASVNGDQVMNVVDLQQIATEFGNYTLPAPTIKADFDINKTKAVDVLDLQAAAAIDAVCP